MARRLHRVDRLTALVLAVVVVFSGAVSMAARQASPDACQMEGHHCGQLSLAECCCDGHANDSSALPTTVSDRVRLADSGITMQVGPACLTTLPDPVTAAATLARPHVPPHGLRFIELPILFATFLL